MVLGAFDTRAAAQTDAAKLDTYLENYIRENNIPGLEVAVVENDRIAYLRGLGIADANGRKVTPQTPFFIGSLTKSFTALAILQLVEAGQVNLDAPVRQYLPWFKLADEPASAAITVRQVLNHTSGIPTEAGGESVVINNTAPDALELQVRSLNRFAPAHTPGTAYEYANANYQIAGLIVQTVSGESYEAYVQRHIFDPLEMENSYPSKAAAEKHGLALGYRYWFGLPIPAYDMPYPRGCVPSGYLISTAEDLAHALIAHMNAGKYNGKLILSPQGIATLHQPVLGNYAMGWAFYDGLLSHNGAIPEFGSQMLIDPQRRLGVVVLFNVNNLMASGQLYALVFNVYRLAIGQAPSSPPANTAFIFTLLGVAVLVVLEIVWIAFSMRRLHAWKSTPTQLTRKRLAWFFVLPLLIEFAVILTLWVQLSRPTLANAWYFQPDLTLLAIILAACIIGWGLARTILGTRLPKQSKP